MFGGWLLVACAFNHLKFNNLLFCSNASAREEIKSQYKFCALWWVVLDRAHALACASHVHSSTDIRCVTHIRLRSSASILSSVASRRHSLPCVVVFRAPRDWRSARLIKGRVRLFLADSIAKTIALVAPASV